MIKLYISIVLILGFNIAFSQCDINLIVPEVSCLNQTVAITGTTTLEDGLYEIFWYGSTTNDVAPYEFLGSTPDINFSIDLTQGGNNFIYAVLTTENAVCSDTSDVVQLEYYEFPEVTIDTIAVCPNSIFDIVELIYGEEPTDGLTFDYSVEYDDNIIGPNGSDVSGIELNFSNSGENNLLYTVSIVPQHLNCIGDTLIIPIEVIAQPDINSVIYNQNVCSGELFTFFPNPADVINLPESSQINWNYTESPGLSGGNSGSASIISQTLTNMTSESIDAVYSFYLNNQICTSDTLDLTVSVLPKAVVSNLNVDACSGSTFMLDPTGQADWSIPNGSVYSWEFESEFVLGGDDVENTNTALEYILSHNLSSTQNAFFNFRVNSEECVSEEIQVVVNVKPKPIISSFSEAVCSNTSFDLLPSSQGLNIIPQNTLFSWSFNPEPGLTGMTAGVQSASTNQNITNSTSSSKTLSYTVTPVFQECVGSNFNVLIEVNPRPDIDNISLETCSGVPVEFEPTDLINGLVPQLTTYTWTFQDNIDVLNETAGNNATIISQSPVNGTYNNENYVLSVLPSAEGCSGNSFNVSISVLRAPRIVVSNNQTICQGESTQIFVVDLFSLSGILYDWTESEAVESMNFQYVSNPIVNPSVSSNYIVKVQDPQNANCIVRDTVSITVRDLPTLNAPSSIDLCEGDELVISGNGELEYQWSPGLGITFIEAGEFVISATENVLYTVEFTDSFGCSNTNTVSLNVLQAPTVSIIGNSDICYGSPAVLEGYSSTSNISYNWFNQDGELIGSGTSLSTSPIFLNEIIVLRGTNNFGCIGETEKILFVEYPELLTVLGPSNACQNAVTNFYSVQSAGEYYWIANNGNIIDGQGTNTVIVDWQEGTSGDLEVYEIDLGNNCNAYGLKSVTLSGLAPQVFEVTQLIDGSSTLVVEETSFPIYQWGVTNIVTGQDYLQLSNTFYNDFGLLDLASFYYWVEYGEDSDCLTRSYFNFPNIPNSIAEFKYSDISVYPNPSNDGIFYFNFPKTNTKLISVFTGDGNFLGQYKMNGLQGTIDLSNQANGVYFLRVLDGDYSDSVRIILSK